MHAFVRSPAHSHAELIQGSDGNFYGTTVEGGSDNRGTVFKVTPSGTLTTLVNFSGTNGAEPRDRLVRGSDGDFYGTTTEGGSSNCGTIFKMTPSGTLTILANFPSSFTGGLTSAMLIQGSDGNFYGTTYASGNGYGTVFKMTPSGTLTTLVNFSSSTGQKPSADLIQGSDGDFYGTTSEGGTSGAGTVFKITPSGTLTTLVNFTGTNGRTPLAALTQGRDGNFYGTTYQGGTGGGYGTIFKMTPSGTLTTLVNFTSSSNCRWLDTGLIQGSDGDFYGTSSLSGSDFYCAVFKVTSSGTFTPLVTYNPLVTPAPGRTYSGLTLGSDGDFYGTAAYGGASDYGMVFKVTPSGTISTIANFFSFNGRFPYGGLIEGRDGEFYGTTEGGGTVDDGTVFKMAPSGTLATLVNFTETNSKNPKTGLTRSSDGDFYGTTSSSASNAALGTVFKMTPSGTLTTLVSISKSTNGLAQGSNGDFYGTTSEGNSGYGTIYKVTPSGILTNLVKFTDTNDMSPQAKLIQGSDGNFYGTTKIGGTSNVGTVIKMTPSGTLVILVSFSLSTGRLPFAELIQGGDGDFYGTTYLGGTGNYGTVFKVTPSGTLTTLCNFSSSTGQNPKAGLTQGRDGNFYGTTTNGGTSNYGTVFKMTPSGTLSTLVNFTGINGQNPDARLLLASDGHLYGTTTYGGSTSDGQPAGAGQIYRLRMGPSVASQPQTDVASTSVTLNGTVNPGGYATPVSFQYGTDPTLAVFVSVSADTLSADTTDATAQASISGLQPGTTYYYRVIASNAENTVPQYGPILSFTTLAFTPPEVWRYQYFQTNANTGDAADNADPDGDDLNNLLERAFNLNPTQTGCPILTAGASTAGLPLIRRTEQPPIISIQYLRRKASSNSGLIYTPQVSSTLNDSGPGGWATVSGTETVQSIDTEWERVTVEEVATNHAQRFGRVRVTASP